MARSRQVTVRQIIREVNKKNVGLLLSLNMFSCIKSPKQTLYAVTWLRWNSMCIGNHCKWVSKRVNNSCWTLVRSYIHTYIHACCMLHERIINDVPGVQFLPVYMLWSQEGSWLDFKTLMVRSQNQLINEFRNQGSRTMFLARTVCCQSHSVFVDVSSWVRAVY